MIAITTKSSTNVNAGLRCRMGISRGGFAAYDYFLPSGLFTDTCGGRGAVLESDFPYTASNGSCACPYAHNYWLAGWSYIGLIPGIVIGSFIIGLCYVIAHVVSSILTSG